MSELNIVLQNTVRVVLCVKTMYCRTLLELCCVSELNIVLQNTVRVFVCQNTVLQSTIVVCWNSVETTGIAVLCVRT